MKAIYQRYLGYDGNEAHMWQHIPIEAAMRYVLSAIGGAEAVLKPANDAYAAADYRRVVEILKHVLFADDTNRCAGRRVCAAGLRRRERPLRRPTSWWR